MRCVIFIVVALVCVVSARGAGQAPTGESHPAFEVVSVKASVDGTTLAGPNIGTAAGRFSAQSASLQTLVSLAYGIQEFRISGGPRWMRTSRFAVEAKAETPVDDRVVMLMLRSLLTDRFGLSLHRELKDMPAYVLLLGKKGPRPQLTQTDPSRRRPIRYAVSRPADDRAATRIQLIGTASMEQLAAYLSMTIRNPVVDGTGLDGIYDINVEFTSETFVFSMKGSERDASVGVPSEMRAFDPELANALQAQLGLLIETQRRPIETLVIDGAALPAEN